MSNKRDQCEPEPCSQCHRAAKRSKQQKKHLYLILDDWERGYSVYKVDVDAFDDVSDAAGPAVSSLPKHPVVRFETRHGSSWYFASHGAKILAMQSSPYPSFPVFDVQTKALAVCPWPRRGGNRLSVKPLFASVAGSLYLLRAGQLDVLGAAAPPPNDTYPDDAAWSWSLAGSSPPPFEHCERVWASVLHPDGRTLFVTHERSTFSFDTESREWASHGDWFLPFKGKAYFDAELEAWVGLCCHEGGKGYLACCDVVPAAADLRSLPAWKLGKDQLFDAGSRRHLGATLVCMGSCGRYCLVESLVRDDEEDLRRLHDDGYCPHRRVLVVTTFGLRYDAQGHLVTKHRKVRSYEMTDAHKLPEMYWNPVAFWM